MATVQQQNAVPVAYAPPGMYAGDDEEASPPVVHHARVIAAGETSSRMQAVPVHSAYGQTQELPSDLQYKDLGQNWSSFRTPGHQIPADLQYKDQGRNMSYFARAHGGSSRTPPLTYSQGGSGAAPVSQYPPQPAEPRGKNKQTIILVVILLIVTGVAGGMAGYIVSNNSKGGDDAFLPVVTNPPTPAPFGATATNPPSFSPSTSPSLSPLAPGQTRVPSPEPTTSRPTRRPSLAPSTTRPTSAPVITPTTSSPTRRPTSAPSTTQPTSALTTSAPSPMPSQGGAPPGVLTSTITSITLVGGTYNVFWTTDNFVPVIGGGPDAHHIHFYFDTVGVVNAGVPQSGPWILWDANEGAGRGSPFDGYGVNDRPVGATQMCVTVATNDHAVDNVNFFHCMDLPG